MSEIFIKSELSVQQNKGLGHIVFTRPEKLNALSLDMVREILAALHRWRDDDSIRAVLFSAEGERAFCAGGDIKSLYYAGMDFRRGRIDISVPLMFFGEEYTMNRMLFEYPKSVIGLMNGITMGGGYGIAGNCGYSVACEKTVFAMPEVRIGLFPDVGSMYHLTRIEECWGRYLAITGDTLNGMEMAALGLAGSFVPFKDLKALEEAVRAVCATSGTDIDAGIAQVLEEFSRPQGTEALPSGKDAMVRACFSAGTLDEILRRLEASGAQEAAQALGLLRSRAPLSVHVSLRHFSDSLGADFAEIIGRDYVLVRNFIRGHNLYEGIKSTVIDKTYVPQWDPARLEDVSQEFVESFFVRNGRALDDLEIFSA